MKFWTDTEGVWVPLVVTVAVVALLEALVRPRLRQVSLDIMENADLEILKETAKNCWTNMGVTAALILTVDAAMLQADPIEPHFRVAEDDEDDFAFDLEKLQLTLDLLAGISLVYCMWAVIGCVVALMYVEPLSNTDAIKFFVANPASIGTPALSIGFACLYTLVAAGMWVVGSSGVFNAAVYYTFLLVVLLVTIGEARDKAGFDPVAGNSSKSIEWQWVTSEYFATPEKWPWFAAGAKKDAKAQRIYRRMGMAIDHGVAAEEASGRVLPGAANATVGEIRASSKE